MSRLMFWNKKEVKKPIEVYKTGSFLFCTTINYLKILSIERKSNYTELVFRNKNEEYQSNSYHKFYITYGQHESFISEIAKHIECVVIPGII